MSCSPQLRGSSFLLIVRMLRRVLAHCRAGRFVSFLLLMQPISAAGPRRRVWLCLLVRRAPKCSLGAEVNSAVVRLAMDQADCCARSMVCLRPVAEIAIQADLAIGRISSAMAAVGSTETTIRLRSVSPTAPSRAGDLLPVVAVVVRIPRRRFGPHLRCFRRSRLPCLSFRRYHQ